jgi:hypothetical protein
MRRFFIIPPVLAFGVVALTLQNRSCAEHADLPAESVKPPAKAESITPPEKIESSPTRTNQEIAFGGIWLRGSKADALKNFPIGSRYAMHGGDDKKSAEWSRKLLASLRKQQKPDGARLVDRMAADDFQPQASSGRAMVMACAINYEHSETTMAAGSRKIFAEIGFDLILCNFADRNVVFTLPGRLQYIDLGSGPEKSAAMLTDLYETELIAQFSKLATYKWSGNLAFCTVGVSKITIFDEARQRFPEWMREHPEEYYSQLLSSCFCESVGVPITPYSRGQEAVYFGLREKLCDAGTLESKRIQEQSSDGVGFILKKPDYQLELVVPGFQEAIAQRTELGSTGQYCAYSRIIVKAADGKELSSEKYDGNVTSILTRGDSLKPVWLSSVDATGKMFTDAASSIKKSKSSALKRMVAECAP